MSEIKDTSTDINDKLSLLHKFFPNTYLFNKRKFTFNFAFNLLLILFYFTIFGASVTFANVYFYTLLVTKALIVFNPALIYFLIKVGNIKLVEEWKDDFKRKKLVQSLSNFVLLAIISVLLLSFLWLWFLVYSAQHGGPLKLNENFVSYYNPTIIEKILILLNVILAISSSYVSMYWIAENYIKINSYDEKTQKIKLSDKYLLGLLILFIVVFVFLMIDLAIIQYLGGGSFEGTEWLPPLIEKSKNGLLIGEILVELCLLLLFMCKGRILPSDILSRKK